jgi:small subunit ribosomal protein S17
MTDETTPETTEEAPVEAAVEETPAPVAAAPKEPEVRVSSKERRIAKQNASGTTTRTARTPEERHAERQAERKAKAVARTRRRGQERAKAVAAREALGADAPTGTPPADREPGNPKIRQGVVTSSKADKTITVRVDTARRHRRYEKIVRSSTKLHAHDHANDANEGDTVKVIECRPLSRNKRWRLVEILERAK